MSLLLAPVLWLVIGMFAATMLARTNSRDATAGFICYVLSYILSNAWTFALGQGIAIQVWQIGLALILLMFAAVDFHRRQLGFIALAILGFAAYYFIDAVDRRPFELLLLLLIVTTVYLIYHRIQFTDPVAKMAWVILLVAESIQTVEYTVCKFIGEEDVNKLVEGWGVTESKYACGRALGEWTPYVAPIITTLALIVVVVQSRRWNRRLR